MLSFHHKDAPIQYQSKYRSTESFNKCSRVDRRDGRSTSWQHAKIRWTRRRTTFSSQVWTYQLNLTRQCGLIFGPSDPKRSLVFCYLFQCSPRMRPGHKDAPHPFIFMPAVLDAQIGVFFCLEREIIRKTKWRPCIIKSSYNVPPWCYLSNDERSFLFSSERGILCGRGTVSSA